MSILHLTNKINIIHKKTKKTMAIRMTNDKYDYIFRKQTFDKVLGPLIKHN